jgi:hypothetical protein
MREWLSIPIVQHALSLLVAGAIIPLVFGIAARIFVFNDKDDDRNDPAKARRLMQLRGPDTPEPDPLVNKPWPDFGGLPLGRAFLLTDCHGNFTSEVLQIPKEWVLRQGASLQGRGLKDPELTVLLLRSAFGPNGDSAVALEGRCSGRSAPRTVQRSVSLQTFWVVKGQQVIGIPGLLGVFYWNNEGEAHVTLRRFR